MKDELKARMFLTATAIVSVGVTMYAMAAPVWDGN